MGGQFNEEFERFWGSYGGRNAELCDGPRHKGSKTKAMEAWSKHVGDPKEVLLAVEAQSRYDKAAKARGKWVPRWPMVVTWLNQHRWDCEIDSHERLNQESTAKETKQCEVEGCREPVHGPAFKKCAKHLTESSPAWQHDREALKRQLSEIERKPGEPWAKACHRWWAATGKEKLKRSRIASGIRGWRRSSTS